MLLQNVGVGLFFSDLGHKDWGTKRGDESE
jgi:hypothetical protein